MNLNQKETQVNNKIYANETQPNDNKSIVIQFKILL